jgi:hypothetical protein
MRTDTHQTKSHNVTANGLPFSASLGNPICPLFSWCGCPSEIEWTTDGGSLQWMGVKVINSDSTNAKVLSRHRKVSHEEQCVDMLTRFRDSLKAVRQGWITDAPDSSWKHQRRRRGCTLQGRQHRFIAMRAPLSWRHVNDGIKRFRVDDSCLRWSMHTNGSQRNCCVRCDNSWQTEDMGEQEGKTWLDHQRMIQLEKVHFSN